MIRSFKHRGLKRLYERDDRSGIRPDLVEMVERIMTVLDAATAPQALNFPRVPTSPAERRLERILVGHGTGQLAHYFPL